MPGGGGKRPPLPLPPVTRPGIPDKELTPSDPRIDRPHSASLLPKLPCGDDGRQRVWPSRVKGCGLSAERPLPRS